MQIGMVTACYKPVLNGVTRMVDLYRQYLTAAGHQVTIFTLGKPDPAGDDPLVIRSPGLPLAGSGYYFSLGYNKQAQAALSQMEILHCHQLFMSLELARRYSDRPIVYTDHSRYDLYMAKYMLLPQKGADAIMRRLWPRMTRYSDLVISPSQTHLKLLRCFGVTRPITVIPNGIDLAPFYNPADPCTKADLGVPADAILLIFVGRMAAEKSVTRMLQQFAQAARKNTNLHLLMVGSGMQAGMLPLLAQSLQINGRVHFIGPVPYENVSNLLAAGDAFVTASTSEVHPLTVIEAMAAGLPIAAVNSPGISEMVIPGQNGFLADEPAYLSEAILTLTADPQRMKILGATARADSRRFDIRRNVQQTLDLYEKLLAGTAQ